MKPIILKADKDGNIIVNTEEIEKMVNDAYNAGYADGRASVPVTITSPSYPPYLPTWYTTVTCSNSEPKGE